MLLQCAAPLVGPVSPPPEAERAGMQGRPRPALLSSETRAHGAQQRGDLEG